MKFVIKTFVGAFVLAGAACVISLFAWKMDTTMPFATTHLFPDAVQATSGSVGESREVAAASENDITSYKVETEATEKVLAEQGAERSWWQWLRGKYLTWTGECDPSGEVALEKLACIELRRAEMNEKGAGAKGDAELFYRSLVAIREKKAPTHEWMAAAKGDFSLPEVSWRDQKYFYRYMAHLAGAPDMIAAREITPPVKYLEILREAIAQQTVALASLFSMDAKISFAPTGDSKLSRSVTRKKILFDKQEIGFLLDNQNAATAFVFGREGIDEAKIPSFKFRGQSVVADFPGPMHADGARLIELGVRDGRVVNFLTGGGGRRSGLVVVTPDGRAFPFHVQAIDPAAWGSQAWSSPAWSAQKSKGPLNLSRSQEDLVSFLTLAKTEKLSVFMEMLLAEEALNAKAVDPQPGLTPIKNFALARGRRLLVWKNQKDGRPSLLVVDRDYTINHAVWAASRLGYKWAINLDCDFIDGARYYELAPDGASFPTVFGTANNGPVRNPYSRVIFFDDAK